MLREISKKRLAKGERLAWNSTIKAKSYSLKKTPIKKVSDKQSREWKNARELCFKVWGERCYLCGKTKNLHVHHWIKTRSQCPRAKYYLSNLIPLCPNCHKHNGVDENFYRIKEQILKKMFQTEEEKQEYLSKFEKLCNGDYDYQCRGRELTVEEYIKLMNEEK